MERVITLNVGGRQFYTTQSTLCGFENFFAKLFGGWSETSADTKQIFVDRDPDVFHLVLSFLRSRTLFWGDVPDAHVDKLIVEAEYYSMEDLVELAKREKERRSAAANTVFRSISVAELSGYFSDGWSFVEIFEGDEIGICPLSGTKRSASWQSHRCEGCNRSMTFEEFSNRHIASYRPKMAIVKKN